MQFLIEKQNLDQQVAQHFKAKLFLCQSEPFPKITSAHRMRFGAGLYSEWMEKEEIKEEGEITIASLGSSWLRSKERSPCPHSACSTQSSGTLVRPKWSATRASSTAPPMALVTTWWTGDGAGAASPFSASFRPNTATVSFHSDRRQKCRVHETEPGKSVSKQSVSAR